MLMTKIRLTIAVQQNDDRYGFSYIDFFDVFKTLLNTYLNYSPVAIHSIEDPGDVQVFPNPSTCIIYIDTSTNAQLEFTCLHT